MLADEGAMVVNCWKICIAQISPKLGNIEHNVDKHQQYITEAKSRQASLVVFPELGLTGYQVQDMTLDVARTLDHPQIQALVQSSKDIDVVFSFVEETKHHLFHVTVVYAAEGKIAGLHRKVYLPTYGMFDERRYFAPGTSFRTISSHTVGDVGLMVCEDAWHGTSPYLLALQGANLLIIPSSSPARDVTDAHYFGSQKFWRELLQVYAQTYGAFVVFANRVGVEDGISFFGGSGVVSPEGDWVLAAPTVTEGLYDAMIDTRASRRVRFSTPILRDERPLLVARELERILKTREESER
jgi:predicted amidohydrolase